MYLYTYMCVQDVYTILCEHTCTGLAVVKVQLNFTVYQHYDHIP